MAEKLEDWEKTESSASGELEDWEKPDQKSPMSGSFFDYIFSKTAAGRVISKFGQGVSEGWGATNQALSPQGEAILKNVPDLYQVFKDNNEKTTKAFNEAYTRRGVWGALIKRLESAPVAAVSGLIGGIGGAGVQVGTELRETGDVLSQNPITRFNPIGAIAGEAGEMAQATFSGQYFPEMGMSPPEAKKIVTTLPDTVPPLGISEGLPKRLPEEEVTPQNILTQPLGEAFSQEHLPDQGYWPEFPELSTARANGVIGNGDVGVFNTHPVTVEEMRARTIAAQEAGLPEPKIPEPPVTDIPTIARGIHPDLQMDWEKTIDEIENLRQKKAETLSNPKYISLPEEVHIKEEIYRLEQKKNLNTREQNRLEDYKDFRRVHDELRTAEIQIIELDKKLRDLGPDVSAVHSHARTLLPDLQADIQAKWFAEASKYSEELLKAEHPEVLNTDTLEKSLPGKLPEDAGPGFFPAEMTKTPENYGYISSLRAARRRAQAQSKPTESGTKGISTNAASKAVEGSGETKTRGLSLSVEAKAIRDDLVDEFSGLPEYETVSREEQANEAATLIDQDFERAVAIAMGEKSPPKGLLLTSVFKAVEKVARANKDIDLIRDLATRSKVPEKVTTFAQNLSMLAEVDPLSPASVIREIQDAREAVAKKKGQFEHAIRQVAQEIKKAMQAKAPTKEDWNSFIDGIMCSDE